jgi:hypothetical protein
MCIEIIVLSCRALAASIAVQLYSLSLTYTVWKSHQRICDE